MSSSKRIVGNWDKFKSSFDPRLLRKFGFRKSDYDEGDDNPFRDINRRNFNYKNKWKSDAYEHFYISLIRDDIFSYDITSTRQRYPQIDEQFYIRRKIDDDELVLKVRIEKFEGNIRNREDHLLGDDAVLSKGSKVCGRLILALIEFEHIKHFQELASS